MSYKQSNSKIFNEFFKSSKLFEQDFNFQNEVNRLRKLMDGKDSVNIFLSEGGISM